VQFLNDIFEKVWDEQQPAYLKEVPEVSPDTSAVLEKLLVQAEEQLGVLRGRLRGAAERVRGLLEKLPAPPEEDR
jgi:hypothetical protein